MTKFAVKLLKSKYYPLQIPDSVEVKHGSYVLVNTEKGEEAVRAFAVPPHVAATWEKYRPETLSVIRVLSKEEEKELEVLKNLQSRKSSDRL